jgi:MOSC domain-containing protein YiiM
VNSGKVEAIFIGPEHSGPMRPVGSIRADEGHGLEYDRFYQRQSTAPARRGPEREVTLIEAEALDALRREDGIELLPSETRRNLVTRGVPLNHLVDREFRVGGVLLRGIRLAEPCRHLESLTREGVMKGLIHRGGLRAQILAGGVLNVGDPVEY